MDCTDRNTQNLVIANLEAPSIHHNFPRMLMHRTINAYLIQSDHIGVLDKLHKSHLLHKEHVDNIITQLISNSVQPKKINQIIY